MTLEMFLQSVVNSLTLGSAYVLAALGLTLVFSIMHIANFAHGELYMIGSYVTYFVVVSLTPTGSLVLNYALGFAASIVVLAVFGFIIETGLLRPLRGRVIEGLILTVGLSWVLQSAGWLGFGTPQRAIPEIFPYVVRFLGVHVPLGRVAIVVLTGALVSGLYYFLYRTKAGCAMRAVQQDTEAASLCGVNTGYITSMGFAIGSALAAAAGAIMAPVFIVSPDMGVPVILKCFVVVIVGGMGSIPGCILAGFVLGFLDSFATTLLGTAFAHGVSFAVLMLILIFRPQGLLKGYA